MVKKTSVSFLDRAANRPANRPVTPEHWHLNPVDKMATRLHALLLHIEVVVLEEGEEEEEVAVDDTLPPLLTLSLLLYHRQVGVAINTGQLN